ncbi:50S ribosomal protein L3 [bacterium]|nr:50S ribosomal protein L3 [bacterium]
MAQGILGRKIGMTSVFVDGRQIPVTVIEAGPCPVVQVKSSEGPDKYDALQLGFWEAKESRVNEPKNGHFKRAGVKPTRVLREFRGMSGFEEGTEVKVSDVFVPGDTVHVSGKSKGRGYSGVMRRHNFHGHKGSHGTHESKRGPGSIGAGADPSRVWKGKRMAGQYGNARTTTRNLVVVEVIEDRNLLLVRGAVPGARNSIVELRKEA